MEWEIWVLIAIAGLITATALLIWYRTRLLTKYWSRNNRAAARVPELASLTGQKIGVVINPSKSGAPALIDQITAACTSSGLPLPKFYETTVEETGTNQAKQALADGADLVVAIGGDGTVRAVATGMVHTGVPMAVIPLGTGNLLARNLDLPIGALDKLIAIAISGRIRRIDVGWAEVTAADEEHPDGAKPHEWDPQLFTVIAGLGFDAAMIGDTDQTMKDKFGWMAYFVAAAKHLNHGRVTAHIQLDERDPVTLDARTVMIANCGRIPGGITLVPDAAVDDGILDVAAVDTMGGLAGWAGLLGEVLLQGAGLRESPHPRIGRIDIAQAQHARIIVDEPAFAQMDGDAIGLVRRLDVWADRGALLVRTP